MAQPVEYQNPQPWNEAQIKAWFDRVSKSCVRDYDADVVSRLQRLPANQVTLEQYGALSIDAPRYPLYRVTVGDLDNGKPNILITGGVHGYEPSGIEACLKFLEKEAFSLSDEFNFVVYPCISPWSYEYDQRWNAEAEDPNRMFFPFDYMSSIEECIFFMESIRTLGAHYAGAVDLHETPDRDIQLRQERASRFGSPLGSDYKIIPNGFYLILTGDTYDETSADGRFGRSIIDEVAKVSPIADHKLVLGKTNHDGVILSAPLPGTTRTYLQDHADFVGVSEVYPDHPSVGPMKAVDAQLAVVHGALNFVHSHKP